jgi:hypothetical protein
MRECTLAIGHWLIDFFYLNLLLYEYRGYCNQSSKVDQFRTDVLKILNQIQWNTFSIWLSYGVMASDVMWCCNQYTGGPTIGFSLKNKKGKKGKKKKKIK